MFGIAIYRYLKVLLVGFEADGTCLCSSIDDWLVECDERSCKLKVVFENCM